MRTYQNICFTLNNPTEPIAFDEEKMYYLVYQKEVGEEGTPHFQGYCELKKRTREPATKALLGGIRVHLANRKGTALEASDYCKKDDTRVPGSLRMEFGEMKETNPGKRNDLKEFKDAVMSGTKRKRDLVDEHYGTLARYHRFYETLTMMNRPKRERELEVILHIGDTGLGKTRLVMDAHGDEDDFYIAPLSNGTPWFDTYDRHRTVLLDDFAGASSHMALTTLLRLLDRYPVMVPTKGGHTWWLPDKIYITTNILPKDWYKWEKRGEHYRALARRVCRVITFWKPFNDQDPGHQEEEEDWWQKNCPQEAEILYIT